MSDSGRLPYQKCLNTDSSFNETEYSYAATYNVSQSCASAFLYSHVQISFQIKSFRLRKWLQVHHHHH